MRLILHRRAFPDLQPKYLTMRHRQRHVRKGKGFKIHPRRSWHPVLSESSSLMTLSSPSGHWCSPPGRRKPWVINSGLSTKAPYAGIWISSISFDQLIYIRRCLLRFKFLCRVVPPHRQDHVGNPDRSTYHPAIGWNIKLLRIDSIPWLGFHRSLPRDQGKHMLELGRWGSPHHHGGPSQSAFT
jgi:hypothetical protein